MVLGIALFCIALVLSAFGLVSLVVHAAHRAPLALPARAWVSAARWSRMTLGAILAGIWILYRVVRGWMALRDGKAMHG